MTKLLGGVAKPRNSVAWVFALALIFGSLADAMAQFGRGPQLDPDKAEAAWALESGTVAKELGVSGDAVGKLAAAYKSARQSHAKAMAEMRESSGGDRMAMMQGMAEVGDAEKAKLLTALKGIIGDENAGKAVTSLGAFSGEWDGMANTLSEFGLGEAELDKALGAVKTYIVGVTAAMDDARASFDFQAMRGVREEHKGKLDTAIGSILSEEQLGKWTEATTRRGRGGRGGGGGGGGGRRGQ